MVLSDTSGGTGNLKVNDVSGGITAANLGLGSINVASNSATGEDIVYLGVSTQLASLRDGRGLRFGNGDDLKITLRDGTVIEADLNKLDEGTPVTVGELLERINKLDASKLKAKISSDGNSLELVDLTTGSGNLSVSNPNGALAEDLGLVQSTTSNTITGKRTQSGLQGPLLESLRGGKGIGPLGQIDVTNRNGTTTRIDLSNSIALRDVVKKINDANAGVIASLNSSKTGIVLQDTTGASGSNLKVADVGTGTSAAKLQIAADVAKNTIDSGSLGFQFINENTLLGELNQGRGVSLGSFVLKDSKGNKGTINLSTLTNKSVGEVIRKINDLNIEVEARLNDTGDGLLLIDAAGGTEDFTVTESGSGTAAQTSEF